MDDLYNKYSFGYYHQLDTLKDEITHLVEKVIKKRCIGELSVRYLRKVLQASYAHLDRKKNDFITKWRVFFETKFRENMEREPCIQGGWMKAGGIRRDYNEINDYKVVSSIDMKAVEKVKDPNERQRLLKKIESEKMRTEKKMKTSKRCQCGAGCPCVKAPSKPATDEVKQEAIKEPKEELME